ncbi:hypothetical protein THRCLA_22130 [Thraustotheca clavata]|uniref:Uncharacterized protein n=1 Tax=Thraustotheca clavata TaxID=74557 RepID=A0A1V9ZBW5_9STRA|nr:hypothetical protein THRCLA_22130 [Thraustotheca clavata]
MSLSTLTPYVLTFTGLRRSNGMVIGDVLVSGKVDCVEARFRLGSLELIHFQAVHAPNEIMPLYDEALVYVVSENLYLQGCTWSQKLVWGKKPIEKAVFILRSAKNPTQMMPLQIKNGLYLQSYKWCHCFVEFKPTRPFNIWKMGNLILHSNKKPIELFAQVPQDRYAQSNIWQTRPHIAFPVVFVSIDNTTNQELNEENETL